LDKLSRQRPVDETDPFGGPGDAFAGGRQLLDADRPTPQRRLSLGKSSLSLTARRVSAFAVFWSVAGSIRVPAPERRRPISSSSLARSASGSAAASSFASRRSSRASASSISAALLPDASRRDRERSADTSGAARSGRRARVSSSRR